MSKKSIKLRQLNINENIDIYKMLQEIPKEENGFENSFNGLTYKEFLNELKLKDKQSRGEDLPDNYVAQTIYWLFVNEIPVGVSKLRHSLTDHLKKHGGHIGYAIIPSERGKGYGNILLKLTLEKAYELGINEVLITCNPTNISSQKVAINNGGVLKKKTKETFYYWIKAN